MRERCLVGGRSPGRVLVLETMRRHTIPMVIVTVMATAGPLAGCGRASSGEPPVKLLASGYSEERILDSEPDGAARRGAPVGKVRLGRDTREAVYVGVGPTIRWRVSTADEQRVLRFGFGKPPDSELPGTLRISAGTGVHDEQTLLTEALTEENARGWHDRSIPVPRCPVGPCWIGVSVTGARSSEGQESGRRASRGRVPEGQTHESPAAIAVSNPLLTRGGEAGKPNVILISLDTLAADHLPSYGGPESISPHIDLLADDSVLFENAFANSSLTHTSHASMLTGSSPFNSEYIWLDGSVQSQATLADALRRDGYVTGAFTGGVILNEELRFDRGFESFHQYDTLFRGPASRTDIELLSTRALAWVERHADVPFFLFLHSYEVHGPFMDRRGEEDVDPSEPQVPLTGPGMQPRIFGFPHMRGRLPEVAERLPRLVKTFTPERKLVSTATAGVPVDDIGVVEEVYHGEIRFTDRVLGRFLAALEGLGLLDNTILVLTSDHGEAFFEHGLLQHGLLYGENLRIPLILRFPPRLPAGSRVPAQVSSMDIAPTILDLAGVEIPSEMDGQSLASMPGKDEPADRGFYGFVVGNGLFWQTESREKLIVRAGLGQQNYGVVELFDLTDDPMEEHNLSPGQGIPAAHRQLVRETIESMPGIHIDFGTYAGQAYEVEIPGPQGVRDRLFGFDIESSDCSVMESPERLRCTMEFSETSRIVLLERRRRRPLDITLHPDDGSDSLSFLVRLNNLTAARESVEPSDGDGSPLVAWRRSELVPNRNPLSPEQMRQLRALGYIQ